MAKIQNLGFASVLEDCKTGCQLKDGCEAFVFGSDARCTNLKDVNLKKCGKDSDFELYQNGTYWVLFFTLPFLGLTLMVDSIA